MVRETTARLGERMTRRLRTRRGAVCLGTPATGLRLCGALLGGLLTAPAAAQAPVPTSRPSSVVSMGQPPQWMPYVSGSTGLGHRQRGVDGRLTLGVHRPIGSPVVGFGVTAEAYGIAGAGDATGGVRLLGMARALNLGVGLDWDARAANTVFLLSWHTATRRGGLFGNGTMLRVDWTPARARALAVGITAPIGQPYAGRTRPRKTGVTLPDSVPVADVSRAALPAASVDALAAVREAAGLLRLYTSFFSEQGESRLPPSRRAIREAAAEVRDSLLVTTPRYPDGRSFEAAQRVYNAELARAFGAVVGADSALGAVIAGRARAGLLDHVILPYDTLFGQVKNRQRDIGGLTSAAQASFSRWLSDSSSVPAVHRPSLLGVHARWLAVIDEVQQVLADQWDDSRRIWLPLQLALAPEEYDEQAEVDALLARAAGRSFSDRNAMTLLQSTDLPLEFARSVRQARDYHVLWIHDFAGRRETGAMDQVGFSQVADGYFPALIQAVQRYDSTGHLTTFQLFLDQNFYEPRDGRLWMTILEDPLGAVIHLPDGDGKATAHLRGRQAELRAAVAASARLQAEAARAGDREWLHRTVKVHVSITQPSDFTFRSHRIIPPISFLPDNLMRDHRKLAFYDLTESDPYRGAMVLGGVGIGEHYATPTWDDRGVVLTGPAALEARAAARRLLRLNGFAESEIPQVLRETAAATGASAVPPDDGRPYATRALQVHNEPGFGRKQSSVARAMLYSLAPRGSVIVVPDPLWIGAEWAGMLAGAALRGCRVFVIAPAAANAPSPLPIALAQSAEVLSRLLEIQSMFGDQIARAGGELRVGIYAAHEDVNDVAQQVREVRAGLERAPWLRTLIPFDSATVAVLDTVVPLLEHAGYAATAPGRDIAPRAPQLHAKTQFVVAPDALVALARQPQWPEVFGRWLLARARQTSADADPGGIRASYDSLALYGQSVEMLRGYPVERGADGNRVGFYYTTGTQNQDPRGMMLDGEAMLVVSGEQAAAALPDFYFLMARSTWITRQEELERYLPVERGLARWLARYLRFVL